MGGGGAELDVSNQDIQIIQWLRPVQYERSLTREERDTKSFGGSGSSDGMSESQESEAGVRGLGLQGAGLPPPQTKWPWPQELMHTSASAASRSVYSRPQVALGTDCSLSRLLFFT